VPAFRPDGSYSRQLSAFSFQPSAFRFQPFAFRVPPTVPGPAGLVSTILSAAQEHFAEASYAVANAFLKLVPQPEAHPAATWQQLGHLHFSLAEYEAAGRAYGYAAAYFPRDAAIQVRLAHTCLHLDDLASFEGYLRRALVLDPESAPALQLLADLNRDEGRHAEAVGYYDRLLQASPGHYENLLSLALCHSYLGDSDTAMDYLRRAGQLARGNLSHTTV
jgi:tetratricopeptide (TPR) repeat protein